jgi:hypothetical protein
LDEERGGGVDRVKAHAPFLDRLEHPGALKALQLPTQGRDGEVQLLREAPEVEPLLRMGEEVLKEGTPNPGGHQRFKHGCALGAHNRTQKGHRQGKEKT